MSDTKESPPLFDNNESKEFSKDHIFEEDDDDIFASAVQVFKYVLILIRFRQFLLIIGSKSRIFPSQWGSQSSNRLDKVGYE